MIKYHDYFSMSKEDQSKDERSTFKNEDMTAYASGMLGEFVEAWSGKHYEQGGSLNFQFDPTPGLHAYVTADKHSKTPIHKIVISYDMVFQLACDATSFSRFAAYGLNHPLVRQMLQEKGILLNGLGLMPAGLSEVYCRNTMQSDGLLWVTMHELAHTLQFHDIARTGEEHQSWMTPIGVTDTSGSSPIKTGKEAEIYHTTELAADDEALKKLLMYITIVKQKGYPDGAFQEPHVTSADIWVLVCAIQCFMMRLYSAKPTEFDGNVEGSHPHQAIRFALLYRTLVGVLMRDDVKESTGLHLSEIELSEIVTHAIWVTIFYWSVRHDPWEKMIPFGDASLNLDTPNHRNYYARIVARWDEIRPLIAKHYKHEYFLMTFDRMVRRLSGVPIPSE